MIDKGDKDFISVSYCSWDWHQTKHHISYDAAQAHNIQLMVT